MLYNVIKFLVLKYLKDNFVTINNGNNRVINKLFVFSLVIML